MLFLGSKPCTFLGYNSAFKGYKCLSSNGNFFIPGHVIFDENQFPFSKIQKDLQTVPTNVYPSYFSLPYNHPLPSGQVLKNISTSSLVLQNSSPHMSLKM